MTIAVLGAAGIVGREISRILASESRNDLRVGDVREDAVRALGKEIGAEAFVADAAADPEGLAAALHGVDVVVNATLYPFNLGVMEGCLAAGCDYLDLGGLFHMTRKQLALHTRFLEAGRVAVLGCGKAPGVTNVLAAWGSRHFATLRAVQLRSGRRSLERAPGIRLPYSAATLLDEFTLRPVVLEDGALKEVEPLSGREVVVHPRPFGRIGYFTTLHSELATLPGSLGRGVRSMAFKVALSEETAAALEHLVRIGFASKEPVEVAGQWVVPRDLAVAVLSRLPPVKGREVWITEVVLDGRRNGALRTAALRVTGDETRNGTAIAAVVGAMLVVKGRIREPGVHPPERVIPAREFLDGLRAHGLKVSETVRRGGRR